MKKLTKQQILIIEELGWNVDERDYGYDISKCSDLGEDFSFLVSFNSNEDDAVLEIEKYCFYFDADEHARFWITSQDGVASFSCRQLVEDAESIKSELETLSDTLRKCKTIEDYLNTCEGTCWSSKKADVLETAKDYAETNGRKFDKDWALFNIRKLGKYWVLNNYSNAYKE